MLQVVKGLLALVIPGDDHLFLVCIFARHQLMQWLGYLLELGDEPVVITHELQEASDLSDSGGGRAFYNSIYFAFISHDSLGRDNVP